MTQALTTDTYRAEAVAYLMKCDVGKCAVTKKERVYRAGGDVCKLSCIGYLSRLVYERRMIGIGWHIVQDRRRAEVHRKTQSRWTKEACQ